MRFTSVITAIFLIIISEPSFSNSCQEKCKTDNINQYFERIDRVFKFDSTSKDIENLFDLFHGEVKYQHLEYGADFGFDEWKSAFFTNLERGVYKHDKSDKVRITRIIHGKNHSAVGYSYGTESAEGQWSAKDGLELLVLFGFLDGKIVLVREYW